MLAAISVFGTGTNWPDVIVAAGTSRALFCTWLRTPSWRSASLSRVRSSCGDRIEHALREHVGEAVINIHVEPEREAKEL